MDEREKRPYVASGSTPNKPREKRPREVVLEPESEERPARRTCAFQGKGSPLQKALAS